MIPNHKSASLSDLDLQFARAVPPGGNWRNIPENLPSARLAQIRESFAAGKGSRSTYYGRLHPDQPSYTIGTYYNRPGNGCFLHPDPTQHRTISHREAARLQSFPDDFVFVGPQRAICQQIGNAVPPLLAMQIANALGPAGDMVDVFAGAGGLSLGFKWAGWRTLAASDIDGYAVESFNRNMGSFAFVGDMTQDQTLNRLLEETQRRRAKRTLALVGGPPCQGFSTGGKKRSEGDARNHLHSRYALLVQRMRPDVFIFENVPGLLSMSKGSFIGQVIDGLARVGYHVTIWRVNAAEYGVPQRRQRLVLVGVPAGHQPAQKPQEWAQLGRRDLFGLPPATSVLDALSDLPAIASGEDGSCLDYKSPPKSEYQQLMRGLVSPDTFLARAAGRAPLAA
jgi:DNA (cytosine-5)-methyltransferase 1